MPDPAPLFTVFQGNDDALLLDLPEGTDLAGATVASQLRTASGALIDDLTAEIVSEDPPQVQVSWTSVTSAAWPLTTSKAPALFDLLIDRVGAVHNSYPAGLVILQPVTRDE